MRSIFINALVWFISKLNRIIKKKKPYTDDIIVVVSAFMGDFLVHAGSIAEYKRKNKESNVSIICNPDIVPIAEETGLFHNIYVRGKGIKVIYRMVKNIKGKILIKFPLCKPTQDTNEYITAMIDVDQKYTVRDVSEQNQNWKERFFDKHYTRQLYINNTGHYMERCSNLFSVLFNEKYDVSTFSFEDKIIPAQNAQQYFVINLGASHEKKRWPVDRFVAVVKYITDKTYLKPVLIGGKGKGEKLLAEKFLELYSEEFEDFCGKTSIAELIQLIGNAAFYLGNDTGTTHIAASCGIPNFSLASEYYDGECMPYPLKYNGDMKGRPVVIKTKKEKDCRKCSLDNSKQTFSCRQSVQNNGIWECIDEIGVNEVINTIEGIGILDRYRKKTDNCK